MSGDHVPRVHAGRPGLRRPAPRAVLAGCAALLTAALALAGPEGAWAAFTGTTANTGNQLVAEAAFPDYRTAVQDSGPVVYHPFDDPHGSTTAAALAGTAGTYNGAAAASSVSPGAVSPTTRKAVHFPPRAYASANSASTFTGTPLKLTLEAWVRTGHGGAVVSLLPDAATPAPGQIQLYVNASGQACVGLTLQSQTPQRVCGSDAEDTKVWTASDQAAPVWRHIAAVIDPGETNNEAACSYNGRQVSVYVDGAVQYDANFCGTWPSTATGRVRVGSAAVAAGPAPDTYAGDIDEVSVYAAALNAAVITEHYNLGKGTVAGDYPSSVTNSSPHLYWQLEDLTTPGSRTAADASGKAPPRTGTYHGHPDLGVAGAPTGTSTPGTAVELSGRNDISTGASRTTPATFSTEVWFRASPTDTGPLVSFGSTRTGASTVPDLAVYLTTDGRLAFSVRASQRTLVSSQAYRDSTWHLVTATRSATGRMGLYVDGVLVREDTSSTTTGTSTGFWRWGGGGDYTAFTTQPGAPLFTGRLDEASVYDRELTPEEVAIHWGASF